MGCKNQSRKNVILTRVSPGVAESLLFRNVNLIRGGSWIVKIEVVKMLFLLVYPQGLSKAYLFENLDLNRGGSWIVKIEYVKLLFLLVCPQGLSKAYCVQIQI